MLKRATTCTGAQGRVWLWRFKTMRRLEPNRDLWLSLAKNLEDRFVVTAERGRLAVSEFQFPCDPFGPDLNPAILQRFSRSVHMAQDQMCMFGSSTEFGALFTMNDYTKGSGAFWVEFKPNPVNCFYQRLTRQILSRVDGQVVKRRFGRRSISVQLHIMHQLTQIMGKAVADRRHEHIIILRLVQVPDEIEAFAACSAVLG